MRVREALTTLLIALAVTVLASCHRARRYTPNVELTRLSVVEKDETGQPTIIDVEYSYFDCPGTQTEVVRGGKEFAACIAKHREGERVPILVEHRWHQEGFYVWDVHEVAGCKRPPDPNDTDSFAMIRECEDWKVNGATVGFQCHTIPESALIKKCPWFGRR